MFEELNKCITKSRLSKEKLLKFQQRYNKNQICLEKIEDSCNKNQGCVRKIFEKLSISITKIKLAFLKHDVVYYFYVVLKSL